MLSLLNMFASGHGRYKDDFWIIEAFTSYE